MSSIRRASANIEAEPIDLARHVDNDLVDSLVDLVVTIGGAAVDYAPPYTSEEAFDTRDRVVTEVAACFPRRAEEQRAPKHIGAVLLHVAIGADDVAAALAHLGAFVDDQASEPHAREWLFESDQAEVVQRHRHEARVEVVALHVLWTSRVEVDRQPARRERVVPWSISRAR